MKIKFILLVLLQCLLLFGMIGMREVWISTGTKIKLKCVPVDPRDIFRGDYARLNYEISTLDLDSLNCNEKFKRNDKIFVSLKKNEKDYYEAYSVSSIKPDEPIFLRGRAKYDSMTNSKWEVKIKDENGEVKIFHPQWFYGMKNGEKVTFCLDKQGNVLSHYKENNEYPQKCYGEDTKSVSGVIEEIIETKYQTVNVEYGIESYFVEEGSGRFIEAAPRSKEILVEVSLNKKGEGLITGLFIDGKKF
ncbi:MAG: GDYXXLXY domain-containing protein [Thermoanaerobaculaceae bacterium]|nr:GDYXXLXY domain-containing protein [Thermoanaerobaculaceae bacterium]